MIYMLIFIFILNMVFAMGMKALLEDDAQWIKTKTIKFVLLIPPFAFLLMGVLLLYGTLRTVYDLFKMYFKN